MAVPMMSKLKTILPDFIFVILGIESRVFMLNYILSPFVIFYFDTGSG